MEPTVPDLNLDALGIDRTQIGVIIVDHGSKREASNDMLLDVVKMFVDLMDYAIVEPAHMELAEPSIKTAFDRCVERGAKLVIVHPYFLLPGRHWNQDIPALTSEAAEQHKGVRFLVTAPLGIDALMAQIMNKRIQHCLAHSLGQADECDTCRGTGRCQLRSHSLEAA